MSTEAQLEIDEDLVQVACIEGYCQLLPVYFEKEQLSFDGLSIDIAVKEITDSEEFSSCQHMASLHYRGHEIHGRTAKLIARTFSPDFPRVLGYVELATPFLMNKARAVVLNAPFKNGRVQWQKWDKSALQNHIHLTVRIGRIVISPEFRGLGIAKILLKHAFAFAMHRWQVAGIKPYFIEISADMLRYVPIAERAGMHFVGETEGNLHRVAKDMQYLLGRFGSKRKRKKSAQTFEESCGICDEQFSRMSNCLKVMKEEGISASQLLDRLSSLSREQVLRDFALFRDIVVLPKPHYMKGLNAGAEAFIKTRIDNLGIKNENQQPKIEVKPLRNPIKISDLQVNYRTQVRRTRNTHAIQQAFGIAPDELTSPVIASLSVDILPQEIILVTGPSGSGKTSLLRLIGNAPQMVRRKRNVSIQIPKDAEIGSFRPIKSKKPLIDVVGGNGVAHGLQILSLAGLAEAFVYLKRYDELSAGQQYRAMLAVLLSSEKNVWIADEFCSNLDPITASIVAHNLQKLARQSGATVIVAAPDCTNFIQSLRPDRVILLRSSTEHTIISSDVYLAKAAKRRTSWYPIPTISLPPQGRLKFLASNSVRVFAPKNELILNSIVILEDRGWECPVSIMDITEVDYSNLSKIDAVRAGFKEVSGLRRSLTRRYGLRVQTDKMAFATARVLCARPV